MAGLS
jgi:hypothetical protein